MRSKKPWEYADKLVPFVHFTRHVGTAYTSRWSLWLKKKDCGLSDDAFAAAAAAAAA